MNNNLKDYKKLYFKYKNKYLLAKKTLKNQKGSSALGERTSSEDSLRSLPSFLKSVSSQESLSDELSSPKVESKRPITPLNLDRPESGLSRQIHESEERKRMSDEDPKTPASPRFIPISLKVELTNKEDIENDVLLTVYTMAYNLLKRFNPLIIKSNKTESFSDQKLKNCVKKFFEISKKIINSVDQLPFLKLNQREPIVNFINECRIADDKDFKMILNKKQDTFLPVTTKSKKQTINYNKSAADLFSSITHGFTVSRIQNESDILKNLLVKILV